MDSEQLYRRVILSNDGTDFGVARPKSMVLDPEGGLVLFLYPCFYLIINYCITLYLSYFL